MKELIPKAESDPERFERLVQCETEINGLLRRTMDVSRRIGELLRKIEDEGLWRERGSDSFTDYLQNYQPIQPSAARRMITYSRIADLLHRRQLALPIHESQAVALAELKDDAQIIEVWETVQYVSEKRGEPVTAFLVEQAIEDRKERAENTGGSSTSSTAAAPGVEEGDLDGNSSGPVAVAGVLAAPTPAFERPRFTERAEEALERLARLCGPEVAQAIEKRTLSISQKDLIAWAEQDDGMIKTLAHYLVDQRWSLKDALRFENRSITGQTDISDLILLCRARGGRVVVNCEVEDMSVRLTVEVAEAA